mgnify:CR=1 FL=1
MEKSNKLKIKKTLIQFTKKKGISNNELASLIGVSSATISNIVNERWDTLKEEMLVRVWNTVKPSTWKIIGTSNFNAVQALCNEAQTNQRMYGLIGYTGAGKTTALFEYYRSNPRVYYVVGKKSMRPKRFFEKLLKQMGILFSGTIYDMIERIAQELNKKPGTLLIIDEAGKLDQTMFMYLHDLRDETINTTGMVLAGVEYFKANLLKAVEKQKQGMPEFMGRIMAWQELNTPTKKEIEAICEKNGLADKQKIKELGRIRDFRRLANSIENHKIIVNQI